MKGSKTKRTKSLFFTLITSNIIRAVVGLSLLILLVVMLMLVFVFSFNLPTTAIASQLDKLKSHDYANLDIEKFVTSGGYIEILNDNNEVVFPSNSKATYSDEDIKNIPYLEMIYSTVERNDYYKNNQLYTLINCSNEEDSKGWFLLLDKEHDYISSSDFFYIKEHYTQQDINYLVKEFVEKTTNYKYTYVDNQNRKYTMLIKNQTPYTIVSSKIQVLMKLSLIFILVIYITFIVVSVKLVNNKIKRPLRELSTAMVEFSKGNSTLVEYKGVNEFVEISNTFNDMVKKLKDKESENQRLVEEKHRMLADISHDLKTPITIVEGYIRALYDDIVPEDKHKEYYKKIYEKTETLTTLINMFADYSKLDHPDYSLKLRSQNINVVVRDYAAGIYNYINDNGFILTTDIPEEDYDCNIDVIQFNRCMENIISNFLKYNPKGTTINIRVKATHTCLIIFENNGTPIDDSIKNRLFEPFVVGDKARGHSQGTGLGLAVVKRIINLHGGDISLSSNDSFITSFIIELPKVNEKP